MTTEDRNEFAIIGIDGNAAYSLLGENLQEGECEFEPVKQIGDELMSKAEARAARIAHARLEQRLGRKLRFHFDRSHPYGD